MFGLKKRETMWVCQACGKHAESRETLRDRDASCGTWAVEVYTDSLQFGPDGGVCGGKAVD